jgi:hypothetical protein
MSVLSHSPARTFLYNQARSGHSSGFRSQGLIRVFYANAHDCQHLFRYRGWRVAVLLEPEDRPGKDAEDRQTNVSTIDPLAHREIINQVDEDFSY